MTDNDWNDPNSWPPPRTPDRDVTELGEDDEDGTPGAGQ